MTDPTTPSRLPTPTPPSNFGLKALAFILAGVAVFTVIAWLTAKYTTPYVSQATAGAVATPPARSVAVLPMQHAAGDSSLAAQVTDSVFAALARMSSLQVSPAAAAEPFRHVPDANLQQAGAALGVAAVLQGTVKRADALTTVQVQLINTRTGARLYAADLPLDPASVAELARAIAAETSRLLPP